MRYGPEHREQARELRTQGWSIKKIAREMGASPSTVKGWVVDVRLTPAQEAHLRHREPNRAGSLAAMKMASIRRTAIEKIAKVQWDRWRDDPSFLFGVALYVAEGTKGSGALALANTDPRVILAAKKLFRRAGVDDENLRVMVQVAEGGAAHDAVLTYWSTMLSIPKSHFNKIRTLPARKNGCKYPMGVCTIRASDILSRHKINLWMELALGEQGV